MEQVEVVKAKGDFEIVLSRGMVEEIVEKHFNTSMLRQKVRVVDSGPTAKGYVFLVSYRVREQAEVDREELPRLTYEQVINETQNIGKELVYE